MKLWFFLLSLLNIIFLLSEFRSGAFNPAVNQAVSELPSILLHSEFESAQRGAAISGALDSRIERWRQSEIEQTLMNLKNRNRQPQLDLVSVAVGKPSVPIKQDFKPARKCFEVGPFTDESTLKQWSKEQALQAVEVIQQQTVEAGDFQVYYPAARTAEQSRVNKMMLNAKGIVDIWMVPSGENKGALSLGVFADRSRANVFKQQLAQRGIQSEVIQRQKIQQKFFAKIMVEESKLGQLDRNEVSIEACSRH